jgi:DNA-binding XRE family transcriptional regulator
MSLAGGSIREQEPWRYFMPALTKTHLTKISVSGEDPQTFFVPKNRVGKIVRVLEKCAVKKEEDTISADILFRDLDNKYTRPGAVLQGARHKEGLTQVELAKKLRITQADLSNMEHGRRTIGKEMAKRLSKVLNIDYRVFL